MRVRTDSALWTVFITFVCALAAGCSGDLLALRASHNSASARHNRGTGPRSNRGVGRDGYSDHSTEVEILRGSSSASVAKPGDHPFVAEVPPQTVWTPRLAPLAFLVSLICPAPNGVGSLPESSRAPPAVA
jgi:hypothetical protein